MNTRRSIIFGGATLLALATALPAFAQGGNTPVPGIDIITKQEGLSGEGKPVGFSRRQLAAVNEVKGMDRPRIIAKIGADVMKEVTGGDQPKGGWYEVLANGLVKNWNVDERGGKTTLKVRADKTYVITFVVHSK